MPCCYDLKLFKENKMISIDNIMRAVQRNVEEVERVQVEDLAVVNVCRTVAELTSVGTALMVGQETNDSFHANPDVKKVIEGYQDFKKESCQSLVAFRLASKEALAKYSDVVEHFEDGNHDCAIAKVDECKAASTKLEQQAVELAKYAGSLLADARDALEKATQKHVNIQELSQHIEKAHEERKEGEADSAELDAQYEKEVKKSEVKDQGATKLRKAFEGADRVHGAILGAAGVATAPAAFASSDSTNRDIVHKKHAKDIIKEAKLDELAAKFANSVENVGDMNHMKEIIEQLERTKRFWEDLRRGCEQITILGKKERRYLEKLKGTGDHDHDLENRLKQYFNKAVTKSGFTWLTFYKIHHEACNASEEGYKNIGSIMRHISSMESRNGRLNKAKTIINELGLTWEYVHSNQKRSLVDDDDEADDHE